jgi:hypothetical protein
MADFPGARWQLHDALPSGRGGHITWLVHRHARAVSRGGGHTWPGNLPVQHLPL